MSNAQTIVDDVLALAELVAAPLPIAEAGAELVKLLVDAGFAILTPRADLAILEKRTAAAAGAAAIASGAATSAAARGRRTLQATCYIEADQDAKLRIVSEATGVSVAALVRQGIDLFLERQRAASAPTPTT